MEIVFTFNGKEYTGELSKVQGAGDTGVYHLMINNYYRGRLRFSAFNNLWVFDGEFVDLAAGFGYMVQLLPWLKSAFGQDEEELFYNLYKETSNAG